MRKFIYIVFMALVGFSCNRDPFEQTNSHGEAKVSLNFEIPASDLVTTYSAADDAARENAIARMDVFAFDQSGAIVAGDEGHVVLTNVTLIEGKGRAMITVTLPAGSGSVERQFGILANAPDPVALDAITTLDGFRALEFTHGSTMRTASFLMSDISALNTITTTTPTINMSLRRAVARVDVLLEDKVTNFVITSARLVNVRDKGFVFGKNTTPDDLSSPLAVPASSGLVSYTAVNARTDEQKRNFSALLYCPENYNADKTAAAATTAVIIGGTYNGATTYYRVNLHDNNRDAQVRRNYIYRVNIKGVNGAGNPNADAAINDIPQNLDYTIVEWDYSLHSDVIFDGKNYLGVSTKKLNAPKAANISTINVVTNYTQDEWKIESCDQAGTPVATPSWLTLTKIPGKISFDMTDNTLPDAIPRETFVKLSVPTNSRMSMIVSVKQSHTDVLPISFEPQIVTASWNASSGVFKSKATLLASGTKWLVKSLTLREDKGLDWCRLSGATVVGSNGTTTAAEQGFELVFDVDKMSSTLLARTAQVAIDVTDPSGVTDTHIVTLTQSGISNTISVGRLYIAKTAEYSIEKISVITTGEWTATFKTGNTTTATDGCTWLNFTDESSAPLTNPKQCKGMGSGSIYVKFDACGANTVRNGYIVVTNGTTEQWIRVHQGDYRTVKINGYEMLDRNLGATMAPTNPIVNASNAATHGYLYQWGRRPDGYEALTPTDAKVCFTAPATSAERVTHQLTFGDPAWGKYIYVGVTSALNSSNGHWLYPDGSITPPDQHTVGELWDSRSIPSNTLSETNITPMRTDYDPCPDGWRVPSAREMDNAVRQGFMQLKPIIRESDRAYHGRFIAAESGGEVCFPTSNNRFHATGGSFVTDGDFTSDLLAAGWYWTSSYSASGSPYALRIIRSNLPDLIYTLNRPGQLPDIYPPKSANTQTENLTGAHLMGVRCIRDRKITEELSVSVRRKTVDMESQTTTSTLTTKNLIGSWSAATSDASWLTVSPAGGSGNGDLSIRVTKNDTPYVRQGEIRITTTSGTVASVVVIQLDDSGIAVTGADGKKRWWRNRNVGATNPKFKTTSSDDTGLYYVFGRSVSKENTASANIPPSSFANAWNLASGQQSSSIYPCPIKNTINDPCPAGWRVPTPKELSTTYVDKWMDIHVVTYWKNKKFKGVDGQWYFLPSMSYTGNTFRDVGYYNSSYLTTGGSRLTLTWNFSANVREQISSLESQYGAPIRCVQETSDTFD